MKKISLKNLNLKEVKQLSRKELKEVFAGYTGSEQYCGANAHYDSLLSKCVCNNGYYFSYPHNQCMEATGSGPSDPNPKMTACVGKKEYDPCSWTYQGMSYSGYCRHRMASELYCADTLFT
ncbi:hypothetical protein [Sphingobacterium griseoflavum]|uniref:Uncharacterized protein n=1 Tax=Sphingobacterium griseoflavum TaxID=1474952 RepID=A0ABQ3HXF3_9SPHI|nr:hypothetical protein [Sphingobacterium griseoflavum]GHE44120.1 hypothetical protein GCM10017764_29360 [Sphingobacterium griseoflavum]